MFFSLSFFSPFFKGAGGFKKREEREGGKRHREVGRVGERRKGGRTGGLTDERPGNWSCDVSLEGRDNATKIW